MAPAALVSIAIQPSGCLSGYNKNKNFALKNFLCLNSVIGLEYRPYESSLVKQSSVQVLSIDTLLREPPPKCQISYSLNTGHHRRA
jgi:hypothetical protein